MHYKRFPIGKLWTNSYLFWNDYNNDAFFVDPGGDAQDVKKFMSDNNINLKMILLTHGHIDHTAGIKSLLTADDIDVYIGSADAGMLKNPPAGLQALLGLNFDGLENFKTIDDGAVVEFPGYNIKAIHTPGHTEGSMCFLIADEKNHRVLLTGDTLFAQSVGRTDLEGGDWSKLENSLKKLALFDDGLVILPGHGPESTIGAERELNPYWVG